MKDSLFYAVAAGVCIGAIFGYVWELGMVWMVAALCAAALLLCAYRYPYALIAAAAIAAAVVGGVRADMVHAKEKQETITRYLGAMAMIEGRVANDPERRESSLHAYVQVQTINQTPAAGKVLVRFPRDENIGYGDAVHMRGMLEAPQPFETQGGRIFEYGRYLRVKGISAVVDNADLVSSEKSGWSVQGSLYQLKHRFEHSVENVFPEPDAALLEGILLGERKALPADVTQAFVTSSLIHIVVLSGYNISIVAHAVLQGLSFLPQTLTYSLGGVLMILFALVTGAGAATVRALIMALVAITARYMHRPNVALRALFIAAAFMLLWNPVSLYDSGFVLSIVATFGLITLSPAVEGYLSWIPERLGLRAIAASTIAVQLYILPALLYYTGTLSVIALPANLLVLPAVSPAMALGFIAGMAGLASVYLALIPAAAASLLLKWMLWVALTAAAVPYGATVVATFPAWVAMAAYVPLTWLACHAYRVRPTPMS